MKYAKLFFWGTIAIGIILSLIVFAPLFLDSLDSFINMPEERLPIIISFILIPLLTDIPFIILAIFTKHHLAALQIENTQINFYKRIAGLIGAGITTFGVSLYIILGIAMSKSSTASLAFIFLPFYATLAIPVGYFFGRIIGNIVLKK